MALIIIIFIVINAKGREKTIEEALGIEKNTNFKIIHEEATDKGIIAFCINKNNTNKYLSTAFVSKNIFGYKDLYSGIASIDFINDQRYLTSQYFPAIKDTPLPIYFGIILNDKIEKVSVKERNSSKIKNAEIINTSNGIIWLIYMDGFKGNEFEIIGYSSNGTELYKFTDTIPWNAEQKALKSPYE